MMRVCLSAVRRKLVRLWMRLCWLRPIQGRKIVVVSYYGGGFGDNGKAIVEELLKTQPEPDIVWAGRSDTEKSIPPRLRYVRFRSMAYYRELATAKVWIDNSRKGADVIKRPGQFYMQTWHGGVPLKRIEKDAEGQLSPGYLKDAKQDSAMADVMLSGCGFFTEVIRRAFWYDGEILNCGSPRLDRMLSGKQERPWVLPTGKKVVLYAPTFRKNGGTDCYFRGFSAALEALRRRTGEEWVFAVRLHPNCGPAKWLESAENVIDVTAWPDLYELLPEADVVISDYSSLIFEAGMLEKPVFLYAADLEAYAADRNFYFRLEDLPFPVARGEKELVRLLEDFDADAYRRSLAQFNCAMDYFENGTAAKAAARRIRKEMGYGP